MSESAQCSHRRDGSAQLSWKISAQQNKRARTVRFGCPDTSAALDRINALPDTSSLSGKMREVISRGHFLHTEADTVLGRLGFCYGP